MQKVCIEKVRNERDRWLSSEEEGRLLAHSAPWLQDIIVFALNTGMRRGEILNLQWQAIDLNRQMLVVMQSKNGEKRTVPLNGRLTKLLRKKSIKKDDRFLRFTSSAEMLCDARNLTRAFRLVAKKAMLTDCRFHDLQ